MDKANKKGQSALEFLTTYGWAFLIILIMIAALAYFGILNPIKFFPNRCNFGTEFQCVDYRIVSTGGDAIRMKLKNNAGDALTVQSVIFTNDNGANLPCTASYPAAYPWTDVWRSGNTTDFFWNGGCTFAANGITVGDKAKVLVTLRYYVTASGANYVKEVKGEIFSTVT